MMSKNKLIRRSILGGQPTQNLRIFPGSYERNLGFQGILGLERKISKFKEFQALKEKSQNSRNSSLWKKNPKIQGIPGLERKIPKIQGIPGLERKIPKFKEFQTLKEKIPKFKEFQTLKERSQNSRKSRFSRWRTNLAQKYTILCSLLSVLFLEPVQSVMQKTPTLFCRVWLGSWRGSHLESH